MSTAAGVRGLVRDVVGATRGHDLALYAAGVTFYATVGVVPLLLLSLFLAEAGTTMSPLAALGALVPASLWGEGIVRAFDRLSESTGRRRSLRGRLGSLVVVAASPVLLLAGLSAARGLTSALGDGIGARLLGVYLAFVVGWLSISPVLVFAYRALSPERPGTRALLWGGFGTGSFLSGTCLGFVLFLSLGIDLGGAYGGSLGLATAAACVGWLFVLHVMVLVGYVTTLCLQARDGHPLGQRVERVRVAA